MEVRNTAPSSIAGIFALAAFAVAVISGLAGSVDAVTILVRAIMALLVCYPIGFMLGVMALRVVKEHVVAHRDANPAPDSTLELRDVLPESALGTTEDGEEVIIV